MKNRTTKFFLKIAAIFVVLGIFGYGGFILGKITDNKIDLAIDSAYLAEPALADVFSSTAVRQIYALIKEDYVDKDKLDEKKMFYGALTGLVAGVGDPYTAFMEPELAREFEEQIAGNFDGIGAQIGMKDEVPTIIAPLPGTPAEQAGLKSGDKIYAVDGRETSGLSLDEVIKMIRGPRGTTVTLLVVRGEEFARDFIIIRDKIELKSVVYERRDDGIFYLLLSGFNEDTEELFAAAVAEIKRQPPRGIILDLRNNPGGLLDVANAVADYWLKNETIVLERFSDGRQVEYAATRSADLRAYKTVVLIDGGSASGSEIVAGALQDYGLATLVGQKSFGKGSVQQLRNLPDGSSLKITVAKWLTPKGREIDTIGITPDVEVEITAVDLENKHDAQLAKAVEIIDGQN